MKSLVIARSRIIQGDFQIDDNWSVVLTLQDGTVHNLILVAVLPPASHGIFYLFAPTLENILDFAPVELLPKVYAQLLLSSPMIPLIKTQTGFETVPEETWMSFVTHDLEATIEEVDTVIGTEEDETHVSEDCLSSSSESETGEEDIICNDDMEESMSTVDSNTDVEEDVIERTDLSA